MLLAKEDPKITEAAVAAVRAAGEVARRAFESGHFAVEEKLGYFDIVTEADRAAEAAAVAVLRKMVPGSRILGEESGWQGEGDVTWIIDPIDGTSNFASGLPLFCVSLGAFVHGQPVCGVIYDPMREEIFLGTAAGLTINGASVTPRPVRCGDRQAELLTNAPHEGARPGTEDLSRFADLVQSFRGLRRLGSCALNLAYVACGRAAVGYDDKFYPWDIAAGFQLVLAGGGTVRMWDGAGVEIAEMSDQLDHVRQFVVAGAHFALEDSMLLGHVAGRHAG